jgi:NAD(P)-dependent dehydrogenase (short-subunit alcohol dehydrogenase family)
MRSAQIILYPSLRGKRVFVTGGGSGIGADIVRAYAHQGALVAFADRGIAASTALPEALAGDGVMQPAERPLFIPCDLADMNAVRAAVQGAAAHFGDIDILVNNTANDARHDFLDVSDAYFDDKMTINLKSAFFAAQAVTPGMPRRGGGAIINLGSSR